MDDALLMSRFEGFGDLLGEGRASSTGIGPCLMRSASVGPSTSSSTRALMPSDSSSPWIAPMLGWFSDGPPRVIAADALVERSNVG